MKLLLDTCVISEYIKSKPNLEVIAWLDNQRKNDLFVSAISIAEIKKGIFKVRKFDVQRYEKLAQWLVCVEEQFLGRILPVNNIVLTTWAEINGESESNGKKLAIMDSFIAATAIAYQMKVVTRNEQDFKFIPVEIINPWSFCS